MAREIPLQPLDDEAAGDDTGTVLDRRQFMRYGFNTATGVLLASVGTIGFAALLMPGGGGTGGGNAIVYYVPKGQEDTLWYGGKESGVAPVLISELEAEARSSVSGISGCAGLWQGLPVVVNYVPDSANAGTPVVENKPRFQYVEGYDAAGKYIGHGEDIKGTPDAPAGDVIVTFARCPHLCCIPGWQLVSNAQTEDNWAAGGTDGGGSKLFCICHSSRFDPTAIEINANRNRNDGSTFEYFGIRRTGGPTPVGLPLIPYDIDGDQIAGRPDHMEWYTYCD